MSNNVEDDSAPEPNSSSDMYLPIYAHKTHTHTHTHEESVSQPLVPSAGTAIRSQFSKISNILSLISTAIMVAALTKTLRP